jgi:hypothetical protein
LQLFWINPQELPAHTVAGGSGLQSQELLLQTPPSLHPPQLTDWPQLLSRVPQRLVHHSALDTGLQHTPVGRQTPASPHEQSTL